MNYVPDLHRQEKYAINRDTGHSSTVLTHVFNTGRDKRGTNQILIKIVQREAEPPAQSQRKRKNMNLRSNSDRRVKYTAERLRTCQTHQRVDVLNTDHKDVAMLHEFRPHLHKSGLSLSLFCMQLYDLLSFLFHCCLCIWNQHC